ncbi:PspA/IM30 family protein [Acidiferrimicrobium sp. IK]|uniref:PspA/IM30 family protein n=1 Tax=Acidiferrimicrobium sp. IK TaxID=2871700 RepID=UPI0021CB48D4|nr:PspA/IM30 family protein [Acidiferrimicrobium sp. IK]MCU4185987.1 PspA/IM30 family protein [Acidiferrimicrobium sp. IK]
MSWIRIFSRANSYAEAKAEAEFDAHADPKVQLEQAIAGMQEHHRDLEAAASQVIAQEKMAKMRLSDLSDQEAKYTKSALAAKQQGNLDMARTFATRIAALREQIQGLTAQIPQLEEAAADARQAVQESADQLQQKLNEKGTILAQVDQANMQKEMAASLKQVSDLTRSSDVPSLDEIKQKVAAQFAEAQASTELTSNSPEVLEMHAHHAELTSEADQILAELDSGARQPAALSPPPATSDGASVALGGQT